MATRKELIAAVGTRYRVATKAERTSILDEFTALTGFHRKHAIRALTKVPRGERQTRARSRLYDEAVRQALIILWEAADRLCGKRFKALMPILISTMQRHGHVAVDAEVGFRGTQYQAHGLRGDQRARIAVRMQAQKDEPPYRYDESGREMRPR